MTPTESKVPGLRFGPDSRLFLLALPVTRGVLYTSVWKVLGMYMLSAVYDIILILLIAAPIVLAYTLLGSA